MTHATYAAIQEWIRRHHGLTVKTCWIAHAKELCGLAPARAHNRASPTDRKHPCPREKLAVIRDAFRHFGMIN